MRSARFLIPALIFVAPVTAARAQNAGAPLNQAKVEEAIDRGLDYLQKKAAAGDLPVIDLDVCKGLTVHELVFYTMVKGGTPRNHPGFTKLLDGLLKKELRHTYCVSLLAMALNALDPETYQWRIAQCAQFLVDNQCKNGQWSYGKPVQLEKITLTPALKPVSTGTAASVSVSHADSSKATHALKPVVIKQRGNGPADGDNSNSQYAALGLRACLDSGIVVESEVLKQAMEWWEDAQTNEGGWSYQGEKQEAYGSMTAGGLGALSIYRHYLRLAVQGEKRVEKAVTWLGREFEVGGNPKASAKKEHWNFYYLYGLERAGDMYATPAFGAHDWYREGASWLLSKQKKDGEWGAGFPDTCWAILFLRRATKPLVKVYSLK